MKVFASSGIWTAALSLLAIGLAAGCRKGAEPTPDAPADPSALAPSGGSSASAVFQDITGSARLEFVHQLEGNRIDNIMVSDGSGGAILDYDGDGLLDIHLVNAGPMDAFLKGDATTNRPPNRLFRNRGDGTFEDVTEKAGVAGAGFGTTAAAADYDNDGYTDLYVVNFGGGILYHNRGDGTFRDVTAQAGVQNRLAGISATFFDADLDGYLDLFVANYLEYDPAIKPPPGSPAPYPGPLAYKAQFNLLYRNKGDGTFEDISEAAGIRIPDHRAMSVAPVDFDLDGDTDLYVSNDGTANLLLVNDGRGQFKDEGLLRGAALNAFGVAEGSMGAAVGDCTGDSRPDLLVTSFGTPSLYVNSAKGFFEDRGTPAGIVPNLQTLVSWGANFLDFDNDGDLDLFVANGHPHFMKGMPPVLFENDGHGNFTRVGASAGPFFQTLINSRGSATIDYNNDGRLGLVITTMGSRAHLLENRAARTNHWLTLKLEGTRSDRDGFGTQVRVTVNGRTLYGEYRCPTSYVFQSDPRLHFGLGGQAHAERIELRWPSGQTQTLSQVAGDRVLVVREPGESRWPQKTPR